MSKAIQGITIKIEGDSSDLVKSLKQVDAQISKDNYALKQLEKSLKLDPSNVDLLAAKEKVLADRTAAAATKMDILKQVQKDALADLPEDARLSASQTALLDNEIAQTANDLKELDDDSKAVGKVGDEAKSSESKLSGLADAGAKVGSAVVQGAEIAIKALAAIGTAAGAAIGTIATLFGKLAVSVVTSYGDLEQAIGGSEAVFGEYASVVQAAAEESYRTLGTSEEQYLAYANKTAALFQGSGLSIERSADLTMQAMQRAADMASVMGIDTASALDAINGAAKGNYSMMDNLGVAMNATTLQAYALSQGITTAWSAMSKAEQAELAMQYFFEQTSQYAGNFEREASETISGSLGMLSASWQSFIAGLGNSDADIANLAENVIDSLDAVITNVTPVVENLATVLPDALQSMMTNIEPLVGPLLNTVTGIFTTLFESMTSESFITQVTTFATRIIGTLGDTIAANQSTLITALMTIVNTLADTLMTLIPVIGPIAVGLITALVDGLLNNIDTLIDTAIDLVSSLATALTAPATITKIGQAAITLVSKLATALLNPSAVSAVVQGAAALVTALVNGLADNIGTLLPMITEAFLTIVQTLYDPEVLSQMLDATLRLVEQLAFGLVDAMPYISQALVTLLGNVIMFYTEHFDELLTVLLELVGALVLAIFNLIYGLLGTNIDEVFGNLEGAGTRLSAWWNGIIQNVATFLNNIFTNIGNFFSDAISNAVSFFSDAWNNYNNFVTDVVSGVVNFFLDIYTNITGFIADAISAITSFFTDIYDGVTGSVNDVLTSVTGLISDITSAFTDLISSAFNWGKDLIDGFIDGIASMGSSLVDAASSAASTVSSYLHFSVPDKGPLADFDESGADMMDVFIDGMLSRQSALQNAVNSTAGVIATGMEDQDYSVATTSRVEVQRDYSEPLAKISEVMQLAWGGQEGMNFTPVVNVWIGSEPIKDMVVDAITDYDYATGGH